MLTSVSVLLLDYRVKSIDAVPGETMGQSNKLQLWGWLLFVLSAVFFIASSVRSGDLLGLAGALLFFVACFVFLVPFLKAKS